MYNKQYIMEEQKLKGGTPEYRAWYYENKYKKTGKAKKKEFEKRNKEFIIRFKKRCKCIKCSLDKWYLIEFHHLDPSKKYKSVTDLQFNAYSIKTNLNLTQILMEFNNGNICLYIIRKQFMNSEI